jgi:hypothetical protein
MQAERLAVGAPTPDANAIRLFREKLTEAGALDTRCTRTYLGPIHPGLADGALQLMTWPRLEAHRRPLLRLGSRRQH